MRGSVMRVPHPRCIFVFAARVGNNRFNPQIARRKQGAIPASAISIKGRQNHEHEELACACLFCGFALTLSAQQSVLPPPRPDNDAPANAEVLKLLRKGVQERLMLHVISATPGKFDTSADALAALKQAGATGAELSAILAKGGAASAEQPPAAFVPAAPAAASAASGPGNGRGR